MNQHLSHIPGPIGVFDSGYGGLTILDKIREALPEYDYIYLGDNARAPLKSCTSSPGKLSTNYSTWAVIWSYWPATQLPPRHYVAFR